MIHNPVKISSLVLCFVLSQTFLGSSATAQVYGSDTHTVTVTVATITIVQVSAPSVNLTIDGAGAFAGQNQMTTFDQSTNILWGVNSSLRKITAGTDLPAPVFTLKLVAVAPTPPGTAAAEFTLSTTATDLLLNIGRSSGTSALKYTGIALASQGMGTDTHTITFTITPQ